METLFKLISIVFEDEDLLVINKPAGIAVHGDGKTEELTLVDWILEQYPYIDGVGENIETETEDENIVIPRPGIIHRIDKETTGLLMIAKNQESFEYFKQAFKDREIKKTYFAFVAGTPRDPRGLISFPIGRSTTDVRKWAVGKSARGEMREAFTKYKVQKSGKGTSILEVWPQTGRTHQIRVHLSAIGHPILADSLYAKNRKNPLGFKRLALHASRLIFKHRNGKEVILEASFPADFIDASKVLSIDLPK